MLTAASQVLGGAALGIAAGVRARPGVLLGVAAAVALLDLLLPVAILSIARKPWDYFAFNAWLPNLPGFLASDVPWGRKLTFLWDLALFWFIADGPFGAPEWGFAVGVGDLVRFLVSGVLIGTFFALWAHRRDLMRGPASGRQAGVAGAFASVLGLSTGPCSVVGCGAPVLPVVGLAFAGLSSGTLAALASLARWGTAALLVVMALAVAYLGWEVGRLRGRR